MSDHTTGSAGRLTPADIGELLGAFTASKWTGMRIRAGDVLVVVGKDAPPPEPAGSTSSGSIASGSISSASISSASSTSAGSAAVTAGPPALASSAPPVTTSRASEPAAAATGVEIDETGLAAVTSPTVGAFWVAPDPGSEPFVEVGAQVAVGDQLGIVEVMKLMNPVLADVAGEVVAIRANNADMVEFGQTLFLIRPDTEHDD
ncbi:MAG: acetyl-CoA carboxylase biotin carboxyl carrier protein subunit [Gordonia sp. (in: high G+C Gram-positive bacteria)]